MDREPFPSLALSLSSPRVTQGSHQFKVTGYSLCKGIGIGRYIASDTFMVGGYAWAIYFYPDGKSVEDNSSHVSLFIALASEGTDVRALFELILFDQSGKDRHKIHSHFGRTLESEPYTLKYRGSMWGYRRFFKRTRLETSDYLKDDCLSIHCSVAVVTSHTDGPKIYSIPTPPSDIGQNFWQLLESGKGTEVETLKNEPIDLTLAIGVKNVEAFYLPYYFGESSRKETDDSMIGVEPSFQDISMDDVPVASASTVQSEILVTVKANYRDDFVRFQLPDSSGIHELYRQVSQRLELTEGTYDLSYQDDDNDRILLACDEDLQFYISSSTKQGNYTLLVSIKSKCALPMLFP